MPERDKPLFLARQSYRRRRVIDAARLLPVFGTVLFLVPILWDLAGPQAVDPAAPPRLAERGLYLFAVWGALVLGAAILARRLKPESAPPADLPQRAGPAVQAPALPRPGRARDGADIGARPLEAGQDAAPDTVPRAAPATPGGPAGG
ncbi:hypothetical protein [Meridianimarinicoccus roseus]|uniref:hypothetical protein n=1 Tax=Meridianimarinicoccus roseus TaxID=2072018 RepID=UPI00269B2C0B